MLSVFDLLVMHPAVADLPAGWLRRLAPLGRPIYHRTGYRLFREDAPADRLQAARHRLVELYAYPPAAGDRR